jgi:ATP-binding cassette, subfamily F, member 3
MLSVHNLSQAYGLNTVLNNVSFTLAPGERAGLIGPNGSGKTTLLRALAGLDRPASGSVHYTPANLRVGYLPQGLEFDAEEPVGAFVDRASGDLAAISVEIERLALALAMAPEREDLQRAYDAALGRLRSQQASPGRARQVLAGLGMGEVDLETRVGHLSGGQKTRLALAGVLLNDPHLLLLDEPTNHLDLDMLAWLEDWLGAFRGAALIVSHDRAFLDRSVTRILELDAATRHVRAYAGNYTDYLDQKLAERDQQRQAYSDQQAEIARLRGAAHHLRSVAKLKRGGKGDSGDKFAKGFFANRTAGTVGRAKHIEQRLEQLMTEDRVEKPTAGWQLKLDFGQAPASGQDVLMLEDLSVGYGETVLLSGLRHTVRQGARVALTGPNGSGKTTLLRTIAGRVAPMSGQVRLGANVRIGYMAQEQELLDPHLNALETIRRAAPLSETEARNFLHYFLFAGDAVFVPLAGLSYGECSRLSLALLVVRGCNLLLLDEPLNHLDLPSRNRFEQALAAYDGTIIAVAHDRYFIEAFATEMWEARAGTLAVDAG